MHNERFFELIKNHVSIQQIEDAELKLKELIKFKAEFEQIFEIYDFVLTTQKILNLSSVVFACLVICPIFTIFYRINQMLLSLLICTVLYQAYVVFIDSLIRSMQSVELSKRLKKTNNLKFASSCQMKVSKIQEETPVFFKYFLSEYRIWHLVLTSEIQKHFEDIRTNCILPLKEYLLKNTNRVQEIVEFSRKYSITEDDLHFLKTALMTDTTLEQMFDFKLR